MQQLSAAGARIFIRVKRLIHAFFGTHCATAPASAEPALEYEHVGKLLRN
jgi:hypothetical protein